MAKYALPCIACGAQLENVEHTATNQPYGGTAFTSHGHYGSTAYDPMDGHYLEINVCDPCLVLHQERLLEGRSHRPVMEDGVVIGTEPATERLTPYRFKPQEVDHVLAQARKEREIGLTEEQEKERAEQP